MRTEHLELLINITNGETINTLANQMHITPQGLSSAIIAMEKELNCTLLNRTKKGVYLTPEAEELLQVAKPFLDKINDLKHRQQEELSGELIIPTTMGGIRYLLSDKIAKFLKENPHVTIKYNLYSRSDISKDVIINNGIVFTAISTFNDRLVKSSSTLLSDEDLSFVKLRDLQMCIECHKDLWKKSTISLSDLHDCKVISNNDRFNFDGGINLLKNCGATNLEFIHEPISDIYYQLLLNKIGYSAPTIYTHNQFDYAHSSDLHQAIITDNIKVEFGYIEKKGTVHSPLLQRFLDFISY